MKLATLKDGTRDGTLLVASRDLARALKADHVAPTLQAALDDWDYCAPHPEPLYNELNDQPPAPSFELDPTQPMAPLPRAYQFADASSFLVHAELIRKSRKQELPAWWKSEPMMYQGCSDPFLGPRDDIVVASEELGIDLEAEIAVVTGDVPMGIERDKAAAHIRLFVLLNDVSLRNLVGRELEKGFGFFQSKPPSALSPVAVTPDELGAAWDGKRVHLPLRIEVNGEPVTISPDPRRWLSVERRWRAADTISLRLPMTLTPRPILPDHPLPVPPGATPAAAVLSPARHPAINSASVGCGCASGAVTTPPTKSRPGS